MVRVGFGNLAIDLGIGRQSDWLAFLGNGDLVVDGLLDLRSAGALLGLLNPRLYLVDGGSRRQGGPPPPAVVLTDVPAAAWSPSRACQSGR